MIENDIIPTFNQLTVRLSAITREEIMPSDLEELVKIWSMDYRLIVGDRLYIKIFRYPTETSNRINAAVLLRQKDGRFTVTADTETDMGGREQALRIALAKAVYLAEDQNAGLSRLVDGKIYSIPDSEILAIFNQRQSLNTK